LTLALLTLLAFALRVFRLDAQSLWYDEGVTAMVAQLEWLSLTSWTANDIQPPLYYYVVAVWGRLAGWSEWSLRFVSVFFGVMAIPVIVALTTRLSQSRRAGLFAALLATLHPLLIYYSQEARMYALLTALGLLIGYAVIVAATNRNQVFSKKLVSGPQRWPLITYIITATAAIYTHYFAFFLLLALAVAFIIDQFIWQRETNGEPPWRTITRFGLANALVLVLYLPWIGSMLYRLSVDNSYWQGRLKVLEAVRSVFISFVAGETIAENVAIWLLLGYALITIWAIIRLFRISPTGRRTLTYALLWLLIPLAAVLILTSFAPKFNPRYVMIALPGLLLIWSAGFGIGNEEQRAKSGYPNDSASSQPPATRPSPLAIPIALLCLTFLYANVNWFTDPAFRKDQWRELVVDLRNNVQAHEAIVLVSGHAWPVWNYYAADIPVVRLPDIDVLDVDQVLDFADTAAPMREAVEPLSDRPGVWLVGWQDEVVDPTGVVPVQLELAGREKGLSSRYWGISLRRFSQIKSNWITPEAPVEVEIDALFGNDVVLRGYRPGDGGELLLFWMLDDGNAPIDADYWMVGETRNANGEVIANIGERRLSDYRYPSFRWPEGRTVMGIVPTVDWLGADPKPGTYTFHVQVYDANQAQVTPLPLENGETSLAIGPVEVKFD
jgi:4-amino-4-deoxy-L-arabinose transferase-like glycosyltransferase